VTLQDAIQCRCIRQYAQELHEVLIDRVSRVLWDSDLLASRWAVAIAELLWAILLAWPGDTFGRPTYGHMNFMPEEIWAVIFFVSACCQVAVTLRTDMHDRFGRWFAVYNAVMWVFVVGSMFASVSPPPAAIAGDTTMALLALWIFWRPYILVHFLEKARHATSQP